VYCKFAAIQVTDKPWYDALIGHLNSEQTQQMRDVLTLAEQRKAAAGMSTLIICLLGHYQLCRQY
jgi:hypothetical protein